MNIHKILADLSVKRPLFHSEADFQHALAWEFQLVNPAASIRLEKQVATEGSRVHIDLIVKSTLQHLAVELKYKTRKASINFEGEDFYLRNHSAQDIGRYDFLRDIVRIERYVASYPGSEGYAVMLTNDHTYWQETKKAQSVDAAFRIHDGRKVTGELAWSLAASIGTIRSREASIRLIGSYDLTWYDFSKIDGQQFRYLIAYVRSTS